MAKSLYSPPWGATELQKRTLRSQAQDMVRIRGTGKRPDPPRDLQSQSGNGKALLTWKPPFNKVDVAGYRVYRPDENTLVMNIKDAGVTLAEIASSSGATPTVQPFFVSCVNPLGLESVKVQVIGSATANASATPDPAPPSDYSDTSDPGGTGGTGGGGGLEGPSGGNGRIAF